VDVVRAKDIESNTEGHLLSNKLRCITNDPLPGAVLPTDEELIGGEGHLEALKPEPAPPDEEEPTDRRGTGKKTTVEAEVEDALDAADRNATEPTSRSDSRGIAFRAKQMGTIF
jgi:hypothetical protein